MPPLGPLGSLGYCGVRFLGVVLDGVVMIGSRMQAGHGIFAVYLQHRCSNFAALVRSPLNALHCIFKHKPIKGPRVIAIK